MKTSIEIVPPDSANSLDQDWRVTLNSSLTDVCVIVGKGPNQLAALMDAKLTLEMAATECRLLSGAEFYGYTFTKKITEGERNEQVAKWEQSVKDNPPKPVI